MKEYFMKTALMTLVCLTMIVLPAYADKNVDETKPADSDGSVSIEILSGSISVIGWDKKEIRVKGTLGDDIERLDFDVDGNETEISVKIPDGRGKRDLDAELEIHVPLRSSLAIQTISAPIDVENVSGDIESETVSGSVDIHGNGGTIEVETVSGMIGLKGSFENAEAASVSGKIDIAGVSGSVEAATTSGSIIIKDSDLERLEMESVSGSVEYSGPIHDSGSYELNSFSGTVRLIMSGNVNASIDLESFSGSINNDFGQKPEKTSKMTPGSSLSFTMGNGSADISIETFSGSIHLLKG